jgi:hypothetical protein
MSVMPKISMNSGISAELGVELDTAVGAFRAAQHHAQRNTDEHGNAERAERAEQRAPQVRQDGATGEGAPQVRQGLSRRRQQHWLDPVGRDHQLPQRQQQQGAQQRQEAPVQQFVQNGVHSRQPT